MNLIARCYTTFQARRGWLVLVLLLVALVSGWNLSQLKIVDSVVAMLPDGKSRVASDFKLLQQAPFARKLVIHLRADDQVTTAQLFAATDRLRDALPAKLFNDPLSGPGELNNSALPQELGQYLPLLADNDDLKQIAQSLTPEQIDRSLAADLAQLLQPQGVVLKDKIRRDPLDLQRLALLKLRYLSPLPGVRLVEGHFLSSDGRSSLILADTPVLITDAVGGKELLDAFALARQQLPAGISADLISGHPYTMANVETIQDDMRLVLSVSGVGILLLFVVFLRRLRALAVYLLPLFSIMIALLVSSLWFGQLSGITVGFGAVLLGITIDFGLHVYFALLHGRGGRAELLQAVSRPVLFGGLTTLVAFAMLLQSELPGQRQLAIFAMAGIGAAILLSLFFLPHFIGHGRQTYGQPQRYSRHIYESVPSLRWVVLALWFVIILLSATQAPKVSINGELRQLSYLPAELQQAEQRLADVWGNMRGRALVFVAASDLQTALQRNEEVWRLLGQHQLQDDAVSLAPMFGSKQTQQKRLHDWQEFWQQHRAATQARLLKTGAKYGFSANAFAPFIESLDQTPELIDVERLKRWGLKPLLDNLLLRDDHGYQLLSLIPDRPDLINQLETELTKLPGVTLVSQSRFGRQLSQEISSDFSRFIVYAGAAVLVLLFILFRRLPDVMLSLLPVVTGILVMFGGMGWLGLDMNLFNVVASILIIGLGVDYGIFMVCHGQQGDNLASSRAVLVSGLTTLVGFGALVLAKHPAMYSIGLTVLLGICAAVPTAVLVIPAFRIKRC
jgi:predicted exporter